MLFYGNVKFGLIIIITITITTTTTIKYLVIKSNLEINSSPINS